MKKRRAALFDMDRTLLRVETASLYAQYQRRLGEADWSDMVKLAYWLAQYKFGVLDVTRVAEKVLVNIKGVSEISLAARCDDWFQNDVEHHIADAGRLAVKRHREAGDVCAIVTAASPYASRPLARILGIEHVVASPFEVDEKGYFTGRPVKPLNIGEGKVTRAKALLDSLDLQLHEAIFYTDSVQDLPLVEAVGEAVCVNPDPRLSRIAKKRGYRIEHW
ncbi:MAG: HAD-IB family hydrolase [Polyangiaceae bacterium]|nr:HAD-IB family hydrolase [Polyangiaceae bacterium]